MMFFGMSGRGMNPQPTAQKAYMLTSNEYTR